MFKAIKRAFWGPKVEKGQIWVFDDWNDQGNPFYDKKSWEVEVKDVKKGWVNYCYCNSPLFQNESMKISVFRFCYKLNK